MSTIKHYYIIYYMSRQSDHYLYLPVPRKDIQTVDDKKEYYSSLDVMITNALPILKPTADE